MSGLSEEPKERVHTGYPESACLISRRFLVRTFWASSMPTLPNLVGMLDVQKLLDVQN